MILFEFSRQKSYIFFLMWLFRIGFGKYQSTREMSYADFSKLTDTQKCQQQSQNCPNHQHQDIRCSTCGHKLIPTNATFLNDLITPHAESVRYLDLFGQKNVAVQEFVNPHDFHFHSIQVSKVIWLENRITSQIIVSTYLVLPVSICN